MVVTEAQRLQASIESSHVAYGQQLRDLENLLVLADEEPGVVLKGNAAALLLDDARILRETADMDILPRDVRSLGSVLEAGGFTSEVDHMPHEARPYIKKDPFGIDSHNYLPVWTYPPNAGVVHRSGGVVAPSPHTAQRLTYDYARQRSVPHPLGRADRLLMPGPTLTAIVLVHDYVEQPANCAIAKVRLAELCEICDLFAHPAFDVEEFRHEMVALGAADALSLVMWLVQDLLDINVLPEQPPPRVWMQEVVWGLLVPVEPYAEQALMRTRDLDDVYTQVPTTVVYPRPRSEPHTITIDPPQSRTATVLENVAADGDHARRVSIWLEDGRWKLVVESEGLLGGFLEEVLILFDTDTVYLGYEVSRKSTRAGLVTSLASSRTGQCRRTAMRSSRSFRKSWCGSTPGLSPATFAPCCAS